MRTCPISQGDDSRMMLCRLQAIRSGWNRLLSAAPFRWNDSLQVTQLFRMVVERNKAIEYPGLHVDNIAPSMTGDPMR